VPERGLVVPPLAPVARQIDDSDSGSPVQQTPRAECTDCICDLRLRVGGAADSRLDLRDRRRRMQRHPQDEPGDDRQPAKWATRHIAEIILGFHAAAGLDADRSHRD